MVLVLLRAVEDGVVVHGLVAGGAAGAKQRWIVDREPRGRADLRRHQAGCEGAGFADAFARHSRQRVTPRSSQTMQMNVPQSTQG
jgi:hypothetical protein